MRGMNCEWDQGKLNLGDARGFVIMCGKKGGWEGSSLLQLVFIVLNAYCFEFSFEHFGFSYIF